MAALAGVGAAAAALARSTDWFSSLGGRASGDRLDRMRRSRQWSEPAERFVNSVPTHTMRAGEYGRAIHMQIAATEARYPRRPIPVERRARADFETPPAGGLRVTWIGHATTLVEIGGVRVLTDPVWSERVSPSTLAGPRRFFEPPIALADLPPVDAVVISHDHYDHLDMATIRALAERGTTSFLVPLGVGAHLERWGVPADRVRELDWGESASVAGVTFTAAPARHFSGRRLGDKDATLWSSWVIAGASGRHRVFYSGDSGWFDGYREIGRRHGPFDLTIMSVGAYSPTWPLIHAVPEEMVQAHRDVRGDLLLPVHWGTFNLAFHGWTEPAERTLAAAALGERTRVTVPRPGQMIDPANPPRLEEWWRE